MNLQKNNSALIKASRSIKIGKIYKHYSGKAYKVIAIAHDSEDPSLSRIVYQGLYDCPTFGQNPIWDSPYTMFIGNVVIDSKEQARFEEVIEPTSNIEDLFHLGIKLIIKNSHNKILVLKAKKETKHYWDLPGGRVQINEDLQATILREIAEETGITTLNNIDHVGMIPTTIRIPINNEQTVGLILSFYRGMIENDIVTLSSEHQLYKWVTPQNAIELLEHSYGKTFRNIFNKALEPFFK